VRPEADTQTRNVSPVWKGRRFMNPETLAYLNVQKALAEVDQQANRPINPKIFDNAGKAVLADMGLEIEK